MKKRSGKPLIGNQETKQIIALIFVSGLFASCSQNDEIPSVLYEGEFIQLDNSNIPQDQDVFYEDLSFLQPDVSTEQKPTETKISDGNEFKYLVKFTAYGNCGALVIITHKHEITTTYENWIRIITFHEGEFEYGCYKVTVTSDGIFVDGKLKRKLDNFQLTEKISNLLDSQTRDVQTTFTGETKQANSESFTISQGDEEYKLTYLSPTAIEVQQTQPINRKIGTINRK